MDEVISELRRREDNLIREMLNCPSLDDETIKEIRNSPDAKKSEADPTTWAWILKQNWMAFNRVCDEMNQQGHKGKVDRLKWREYVLWDMNVRHYEETRMQEMSHKEKA